MANKKPVVLYSGDLKEIAGSDALDANGGMLTNLNVDNVNSGVLPPVHGGTGVATITAHGVMLGAGTSAITTVVGTTSGDVLTWNGTTWAAATPSGGGGGGSSETFLLITSDVTITAGSLTTITGLTFAIAAGETWIIEVHINGTSTSNGHTRFGFAGPSSPTVAVFKLLGEWSSWYAGYEFISGFGTVATQASSAWAPSPPGGQNTWHAYGTVIAGASSGTFAVQGYVLTGTLVVKAGTYLRAVKQ